MSGDWALAGDTWGASALSMRKSGGLVLRLNT